MTFRVCVCGGRDYNDREAVFATLERLNADEPISWIIHGGATGADSLAEEWARLHSVGSSEYVVTPDEWRKYGRAAGPQRNARMLASAPDLVVAFPGGRGTADCVRQARKLGIPIHGDTAEVKR